MKKNSPLWYWITSQLPTPTEKKSMYSDITNRVVSPYHNQPSLLQNLFSKKLTWSVALCLVVIYTTNQVSASALPGDLSYPIKIAREEVILITKPTAQKKADYLIKRIENRIEEKHILIETKELKKEDSLVLDNLIAKTTEQFNTQIVDITTESSVIALDYQNTMTALLDSHSETILATSSEEITSTTAVLALEKQQEHANQIKTELEQTVLDIDPIEAEKQYYEKIALLNTEYPDIFPVDLITQPVPPVVDSLVTSEILETTPREESAIVTEQKSETQPVVDSAVDTLTVSSIPTLLKVSETVPVDESVLDTPVIVSDVVPLKKPETVAEFLTALTTSKNEKNYAQGIILLSDLKIILQKQKLEKLKQLELDKKIDETELSNEIIVPTIETEKKTDTLIESKPSTQ